MGKIRAPLCQMLSIVVVIQQSVNVQINAFIVARPRFKIKQVLKGLIRLIRSSFYELPWGLREILGGSTRSPQLL